jgi:membrane protein required for beta-lactamase induction
VGSSDKKCGAFYVLGRPHKSVAAFFFATRLSRNANKGKDNKTNLQKLVKKSIVFGFRGILSLVFWIIFLRFSLHFEVVHT